jgi:hypothetical protein
MYTDGISYLSEDRLPLTNLMGVRGKWKQESTAILGAKPRSCAPHDQFPGFSRSKEPWQAVVDAGKGDVSMLTDAVDRGERTRRRRRS